MAAKRDYYEILGLERSCTETDIKSSYRKAALKYPETEEGVACEGTALEKRTIKVRNKAFVFLGTKDAMVKLGGSRAEAKRLGLLVGANGWVKVPFDGPAKGVLLRWIEESYRLMAPKKLAAAPPPPRKR